MNDEMIKVRRALLSVTDKTGLVDFARGLAGLSIEILSTGGTASLLREAGIKVTDVASVTGLPEMLDGRVKTLHPAIHGGILADRDRPGHREDLEREKIEPIDMVVVNLYAFEAAAARSGATDQEVIEKIDIGGPGMIRAAAKNHRHVLVVTDPGRYGEVLAALRENRGAAPRSLARTLARDAFHRTAAYDAAIAGWFDGTKADGLPAEFVLRLEKIQDLRYGENPHQPGAVYRGPGERAGLSAMRQLQGKDLSFTNYLDVDAVLRVLDEFDEPAAVVVKHLNPCGVGYGRDLATVWARALAADPLSAFGGVVGFNRPVDGALARALSEIFLEVIAAPTFREDAVQLLSKKKNLRLLEIPPSVGNTTAVDVRRVKGAWLLQGENPPGSPSDFKVVTKRTPTDHEIRGLQRAWRIVKRVKSNAIVLADATGSVGIGCGQTSRIDALEDAIRKAGRGVGIGPDTVLASDAFFPFRDSIDRATQAGIKAVIQPGGSVKDEDSIAACDEHGIAMVFTGQRVFLH